MLENNIVKFLDGKNIHVESPTSLNSLRNFMTTLYVIGPRYNARNNGSCSFISGKVNKNCNINFLTLSWFHSKFNYFQEIELKGNLVLQPLRILRTN